MARIRIYFIVATWLSLVGIGVRADDAGPSPIESKLRDALRNTMLQLRDANTQIATLQEEKTESDKEKSDLNAQIDNLNKKVQMLIDQAASDKAASEKAVADLKQNEVDLSTQMVDTLSTRINSLDKPSPNDQATLDKSVTAMKALDPDLKKQLDQYATDIEIWTKGYEQYAQLYAKTEGERQRLAVQVIMLQRLVQDRETKNLELFKTGNEILDRYEKFNLGDALGAKEPFIGITRVKMQEFVQDYKDKLTAQRIAIGQPPAVVVKEAGTPAANPHPPAKAASP